MRSIHQIKRELAQVLDAIAFDGVIVELNTEGWRICSAKTARILRDLGLIGKRVEFGAKAVLNEELLMFKDQVGYFCISTQLETDLNLVASKVIGVMDVFLVKQDKTLEHIGVVHGVSYLDLYCIDSFYLSMSPPRTNMVFKDYPIDSVIVNDHLLVIKPLGIEPGEWEVVKSCIEINSLAFDYSIEFFDEESEVDHVSQ